MKPTAECHHCNNGKIVLQDNWCGSSNDKHMEHGDGPELDPVGHHIKSFTTISVLYFWQTQLASISQMCQTFLRNKRKYGNWSVVSQIIGI